MRHERFLEPISTAEPCGPDLDETGDDGYLNYVLAAEARVPDSYFDEVKQAVFDRNRLDLKGELKAIDALLDRSRDLRLIGLEARFQAFAGSIVGVSDCIRAMADLVERFWDDLHPKPLDEEDPVRQNVLGGLDDRSKIVVPLHYAAIIRDKRLGQVTWRMHLLATGAARARDGETAVAPSDILQALGSDENGGQTASTHAAVVGAIEAMAAMRALFEARGGHASAPSFGALKEFFDELRTLIETGRPELAASSNAPAADPDAVDADATSAPSSPPDGGSDVATSVAPTPLPPMPALSAVLISSHAEASAAMAGAEAYFAAYEPSAPALILVHQARQLVGKPLVQALEMLMPEAAERAVIRFESGLKFKLPMSHLRMLTEGVADRLGGGDDADAERSFGTQTRPGAAALLAGVEEFYRRAEPSSPIPLLLARARSYLNRDFTMILNDLIEKSGDSP